MRGDNGEQARMQAASPRSNILLRTSGSSGHGIGTSLDEQIEEQVESIGALDTQLGRAPTARGNLLSGRTKKKCSEPPVISSGSPR